MAFRGESLGKCRRVKRLLDSDMVKKHPHKSRKPEKSKERSWMEFINDKRDDKPIIPVGCPFQAEIPDWTSLSRGHRPTNQSSDAKWLGTQVLPNKPNDQDSTACEIGKGRPNSCECASPGSVECVKYHVADKKVQMKLHLGTAFKEWKFDEMGEEVSKSWTLEEQKKFNSVVRRYPSWDKEGFLQLVWERFPYRSKEEIVKYYFNVFVPRRMSFEATQKRKKPDNCTLRNSKNVQSKYLKVPKKMRVQ